MGLIEKAIVYATKAHEGQKRKGTDIPYITHPFTVGMYLQQQNCSEQVVAAGILHDTVEDTYVTLDDIVNEFGKKVAELVAGASEPNKEASWEERKEHTIKFLEGASIESRLVSCADKLHNIRTDYEEIKIIGDKLWEKFKRGKEKQEWYYKNLVKVLCDRDDIPEDITIFKEFKSIVNEVFGE